MNLNKLYPVPLTAVCKDYIWGGTRLRTEYHQKSDAGKVAESWMLSCHPDGPSVVASGECAGTTLAAFIEKAGKQILGTDCEKLRGFPVLVKLIDARDPLSVQVHPDDAYALGHGGDNGKTEMWYVVDCDEGASLYYGFDHEISLAEFRERIESNTLTEVLNKVPVRRGDVFFIEAGTLHAIGAGILIAEIQQSSNLTYRVYDYGRLGADGKPRELHVAEALDVTRRERPKRPVGPQGKPVSTPGCTETLLASCRFFTVRHLRVTERRLRADERSFQSLVCLSGEAQLLGPSGPLLPLRKGGSVFVPAGMGPYTVKGDCELLLTEV